MGSSRPESLLKCSFNNLLESYSLIFLRAISFRFLSNLWKMKSQPSVYIKKKKKKKSNAPDLGHDSRRSGKKNQIYSEHKNRGNEI